jgi:hypothetical protein
MPVAPDYSPQHECRSNFFPVFEPGAEGADLLDVPPVAFVQVAQDAFAVLRREGTLEEAAC